MEKKSYFAVIPANVRYDKDLSANAKLLYGEITALANEKGYCYAQNAYFAELYDVSKTTISRWIKQLTEKGYLSPCVVRDENTQEVIERRLYINITPIDEIVNTSPQKCGDPPLKKINTLPTKMSKRIIHVNNTFNNTFVEKSEAFKELYNSSCKKLPKVSKLSKARIEKIKTRLKDEPDLEVWRKAFEIADKTPFCTEKKWCNFDWFVANDTNYLKVLEGKYGDTESASGQQAYQEVPYNGFC